MRSHPGIRVIIVTCLLGLVLLFAAWNEANEPVKGPHGALELWLYKSADSDSLAVQYSVYFATAGRCAGCHGHDPLADAMVDESGVDVNVADDWRSTMMGNSARDPFFRAKMEHEVLVNPGHQGAIEKKCTSCHAPLGMHEQRMLGAPDFTSAMLDTSTIGLDGVSCLACHMQNPDAAGSVFSGDLVFDSAQVYGPYEDDVINAGIMQFFVGFRPQYGEQIIDGRVCAGCHSLTTETLDLAGNLTGDHFFEQATWQEWKNSSYTTADATTCRGCHMPRTDDGIILASEYAFLPPHSPFGKHHLAGGNEFMLKLLKEHRLALGLPALDVQFDSTIARTTHNLQHATLSIDAQLTDRDADTARIDIRLANLAGHKFPSGYPSRRAFIRLIVTANGGDTLFQSGRWDNTYELVGHDAGYEPHHDVITQPDQVQIYEMVMGDVNGDVTTVLERAKDPIKDNRLPPLGFSTAHVSYDTCTIAGVPASDIDFNHDALGFEGNGGDVVHYHVPLNGFTGMIHVHASAWYQPVPPQWNQEMFSFNGPRIDSFRTMYENADGTPSFVAADSLSDDRTAIDDLNDNRIVIWPDPSPDGVVHVHGNNVLFIATYDAKGTMVNVRNVRTSDGWSITLPPAAGAYLLHLRIEGRDVIRRIVRE